MRLSFPIRAIGGSVIPEAEDNPVYVPGRIEPVLELPGICQSLVSTAPGAQVQEDSIIAAFQFDTAASSGSASNGVVFFAAGVWRITWQISFLADFAGPVAAGSLLTAPGLNLRNVSGIGVGVLCAFKFIANTPIHETGTLIFNNPQDGTNIRYINPVTGVGQTCSAIVSVVGSRLA